MTARKTLRATRKTAATPLAAFRFPSAVTSFDFPRGVDFGLAPLVSGRPLGAALRGWPVLGRRAVKAARMTKHGVTVKAGGKTSDKSGAQRLARSACRCPSTSHSEAS